MSRMGVRALAPVRVPPGELPRGSAIRTALGRGARSRSQRITHFWLSWDCVATDVAQLSQMLAFQTLSAVIAEATYQSGYNRRHAIAWAQGICPSKPSDVAMSR